jgi:hypothetical protein
MATTAATSAESSADLRSLVTDPAATIDIIARELDALPASEKLAALRTLSRDDQRRLYQKAAGARGIELSDFVPADRAPLAAVHHSGTNTLPLPRPLRFFEKRFCRPEDGSERLFGYNESPFVRTVGPGFFVAVPTRGNASWEARGSVVVDYFQVPDGKVSPTFPQVVPNTKGLQRFVYHQTRDFMRRVAEGVSIGAAYKIEKSLDHYFVLLRLD